MTSSPVKSRTGTNCQIIFIGDVFRCIGTRPRKGREMEKIYFDNGSTSFPKAPGVGRAMAELLERGAFNINRGGYEGAYEVAGRVLDTREMIAKLFHAESSRQVIFTPGITWSLNMLLKGLLREGDHVVVSGMEHNGVMRPLEQLRKTGGISYDVAKTSSEGEVTAEAVEEKIGPRTKLVLVLHASNVCGTVLPIEEIGEVCKRHGVFFAVDTAQSAGTLSIDMQKANIDFLGFTGHKGLKGPQGIGGFLISPKLNACVRPVILGGTGSHSDLLSQPEELPDKYESGTMNLPGIIGLHAALSYLEKTGIHVIRRKKEQLTARFLEGVSEIPGVRVIGKKSMEHRTAVVSLDFPEMDNAIVAFLLEQEYGIMTRVGLHCAPLAHQSLGTFPKGTVRFSFSEENTEEEIARGIEAVKRIVENRDYL